ncbi:hypothetical protein [Aliarcobacter butzleri]|uniref:hypothetical protein n=1 Tax=Aliarcobacter butzleri TaxID=28197 RepID=UPI00263C46BC|nr:hypothetical protein [Aliarcobacter butzleri]MDN5054320.1 hypothetical protein [Aliarcobacter butzleri]
MKEASNNISIGNSGNTSNGGDFYNFDNPIFIFATLATKEDINIRKVFYKNREIIKISAILFPLILYVSVATSFGFEEIFLYFSLPYNKFIFFISYVLFFIVYFYFLIKYRWLLDKGTLKYKDEKILFTYNNEFEEINYLDISKVEKEKSFIIGTTFFIYTKNNEKAKIKFNFYNYEDVLTFEDKLKNKNISIDNL